MVPLSQPLIFFEIGTFTQLIILIIFFSSILSIDDEMLVPHPEVLPKPLLGQDGHDISLLC